MSPLNQAPDGALVDRNGTALPGYKAFLSALSAIIQALTLSGTTAQRPTALLWIGRPYWDSTLTKPIWVKAVNASGVATWADATGATV